MHNSERYGTSGPFDGPSTTTWRRQRLLRIGSISSVQSQPLVDVGEDEQGSPPPVRLTRTLDELNPLRPSNNTSYGTLPPSRHRPPNQNTLFHRLSDINLPGSRFFSASSPPSPVLVSPSYFRNANERPISAYDAALGLQSDRLDKETEPDAKINGIRVWYSSFSSIDWLHDAIKDSVRFSRLRKRRSLRARVRLIIDKSIGWWIVTIVGFLTAIVAFLIVRSEQWLFDSKEGYCRENWRKAKRFCCPEQADGRTIHHNFAELHILEGCDIWRTWAQAFGSTTPNGGWFDIEQEVIEYIAYAIVAVCRPRYVSSWHASDSFSHSVDARSDILSTYHIPNGINILLYPQRIWCSRSRLCLTQ